MTNDMQDRRDKEQADRQSLEAMKRRLQQAFATPDSDYEKLSADDIRQRAVAISA
jgi:hypothetical protein